MNIVNNYSSTMVQIIQDVIKSYERNEERIKSIEGELNDLNHEIELTPSRNMYDAWRLYKDIRDLRIERRQRKEENELMKDMYDYFKGQQGQSFKSKIQQIQGNAAKLREIQERRMYTPRQRNDLTCTDKHSDAHKPFEEMMKKFNETKISTQKGKLRK